MKIDKFEINKWYKCKTIDQPFLVLRIMERRNDEYKAYSFLEVLMADNRKTGLMIADDYLRYVEEILGD